MLQKNVQQLHHSTTPRSANFALVNCLLSASLQQYAIFLCNFFTLLFEEDEKKKIYFASLTFSLNYFLNFIFIFFFYFFIKYILAVFDFSLFLFRSHAFLSIFSRTGSFKFSFFYMWQCEFTIPNLIYEHAIFVLTESFRAPLNAIPKIKHQCACVDIAYRYQF